MDCRVMQRFCLHGGKSKYKGHYYVISRKKETHEKKTFKKRTCQEKTHQQTSFSLEFSYPPRCSLKYQPFRDFLHLWLAAFEHHHRLWAQCDNAIGTCWFPWRKLLCHQKAFPQCAQTLMTLMHSVPMQSLESVFCYALHHRKNQISNTAIKSAVHLGTENGVYRF